MKERLKVAVSCPGLSGLGGGVKHGLLLVRPLIGLHDITILHQSDKGIPAEGLRQIYGIDLTGVKFRLLDHEYSLRRITQEYDVFINIGYGCLDRARARKNILLVFFPMPIDDLNGALPLRQWIGQQKQRGKVSLLELTDAIAPSLEHNCFHDYRTQFGLGAALVRSPLFALRKLGWSGKMPYRLGYPALNDYDLLLSNSEYTSGWIKRYYGKESELSYPPIDTASFTSLPKQRLMLSVGRFEPEGMSKRHDSLIEAFRALHQEGSVEGWKLVICGGSDGSQPFESTIAKLRKAAEGLPVSVEVNAPFSRLRELYGTASIYLHAMGLDEDPERFPWRYEHFGMTTAEAMAAEAVPFVLAAGGQREIVTHGENGFLWHSLEQLKQQIRAFTTIDPALERRLRKAARERALDFSDKMFYNRTCAMYRGLGIECLAPDAIADTAL